MEDLKTVLNQARRVSKTRPPADYQFRSDTSLSNQEDNCSQVIFSVSDIDEQSYTELSPADSTTSSNFSRAGSIKQKFTSLILSPTQFLRSAASSSKASTLPHIPTNQTDSACKVPPRKLNHRYSLTECYNAGISTIPEDRVYSQYALQHDPHDVAEDTSLIVRRSSLTGQVEQYFRLPTHPMEDHSSEAEGNASEAQYLLREVSKKRSTISTSKSTQNFTSISCKSPKAKRQTKFNRNVSAVLLPSTETTV